VLAGDHIGHALHLNGIDQRAYVKRIYPADYRPASFAMRTAQLGIETDSATRFQLHLTGASLHRQILTPD